MDPHRTLAEENAIPERYPSEVISIQQTADQLGVCTKTVRRYIADGRLKAVRLGPRLIRVETKSIEALMRPIGK